MIDGKLIGTLNYIIIYIFINIIVLAVAQRNLDVFDATLLGRSHALMETISAFFKIYIIQFPLSTCTS